MVCFARFFVHPDCSIARGGQLALLAMRWRHLAELAERVFDGGESLAQYTGMYP
jgi:hypothetical protein